YAVRSITQSGSRSRIFAPNTPAASSAARSSTTGSTLFQAAWATYGCLSPRLTQRTECPASASRGVKYEPICPEPPMITTRITGDFDPLSCFRYRQYPNYSYAERDRVFVAQNGAASVSERSSAEAESAVNVG